MSLGASLGQTMTRGVHVTFIPAHTIFQSQPS
jgi:hypothetical protein